MKFRSLSEVCSYAVLSAAALSAVALSATASAADRAVQLTVEKGEVEFVAVGWPSALRIKGTGGGVAGELAVSGDQISGRITLALDSLETGIDLRDRHMREQYLETPRYPRAVFQPTRLAVDRLPESETFKPQVAPFEGLLDLHGTQRPVKGTARVSRRGAAVEVEATFDLRTSDFDIRTPSYMGITVAQDVKVTVRLSGRLAADERLSQR